MFKNEKVKKTLSLILTVVILTTLVVGVIPMSAMADTPFNSEQQIEKDASKSALYYAYNGSSFDTAGSTDAVVKNNGDASRVEMSKTIAGTGTENVFDITLKVETDQIIEKISSMPDAAVSFVMDISNSMKECIYCGTGQGTSFSHKSDCPDRDSSNQKLKVAKKSALEFIAAFAKSGQDENGNQVAKRYLSLTVFYEYAVNKPVSGQQWIDVAAIKTWGGASQNAVEQVINGLSTGGDTNIAAALKEADSLINGLLDKEAKNEASTLSKSTSFVVLLGDGAPTISTNASGPSGYSKYTTSSEGKYTNAERWARKIREGTGVSLSTIYVGNQTSASTWFSAISTTSTTASSPTALLKGFDDIITLMRLSTEAWEVSDPMGKNIIYVPDSATSSNTSYAPASKTLTWVLREDVPVVKDKATGSIISMQDVAENGNYTFTYTLKYSIYLDTLAEGASSYQLTNGRTTLAYYLKNAEGKYTNDAGTVITNDSEALLTMDFKVPKVIGFYDDIEFLKVDDAGKPIEGIKFELTHSSTCGCLSAVDFEANANSVNDGLVSFRVPSGHTYTITEAGFGDTEANAQFAAEYQHNPVPIVAMVSEGKVTLASDGFKDFKDTEEKCFVNQRNGYDVTVNYYVNNDLKSTAVLTENVKLQLDDDYNAANSELLGENGSQLYLGLAGKLLEDYNGATFTHANHNYSSDSTYNSIANLQTFIDKNATIKTENLPGNVIINLYYEDLTAVNVPVVKTISWDSFETLPSEFSFTFKLSTEDGIEVATATITQANFTTAETRTDTGFTKTSDSVNFAWTAPFEKIADKTLYISEVDANGWDKGIKAPVAYVTISKTGEVTRVDNSLAITNDYVQPSLGATVNLNKSFAVAEPEAFLANLPLDADANHVCDKILKDPDFVHTHETEGCILGTVCVNQTHLGDEADHGDGSECVFEWDCGVDSHDHTDSCYEADSECTAPACFSYTFTFTLLDGSSLVDTQTLTLTAEQILNGGQHSIAFSVPASLVAAEGKNLQVVETSGYSGWTLASPVSVTVARLGGAGSVTYPDSASAVAMTNTYDAASYPSITILKSVYDARNEDNVLPGTYETFSFSITGGGVNRVVTITVDPQTGSGSTTVELTELYDADAILTITELGTDTDTMTYDKTSYTVEIVGGAVSSSAPTLVFKNYYKEIIIPSLGIVKSTINSDGAFTFKVGESSADITTTNNSGTWSGKLEPNFSGIVKVTENDLGEKGWIYDGTEYSFTFAEGVLTGSTIGGVPTEVPVGTASFTNAYYAPEVKLYKSAASSSVLVGDTVSYNLRFTNTGNEALEIFTLNDSMFDIAQNIKITGPSGEIKDFTQSGTTINFDALTLAVGESVTVTYSVTFESEGSFPNTATVSGLGSLTEIEASSNSEATVTVRTSYVVPQTYSVTTVHIGNLVDGGYRQLGTSTQSGYNLGDPYTTAVGSFDGFTFLEVDEARGAAPSGTIDGNKTVYYIYEQDEDIEDPEDPTTDTPEDPTEIPEDETPLEGGVYIPDDEMPLSDVPQTSDANNIILLIGLMVLCLAGLIVLNLKPKKEEQK